MEIIANRKIRFIVHDDHFALMKKVNRNNVDTWQEHKWFSKLESLINYVAQKEVASKKITITLPEFLKQYKSIRNEIAELITESNNSGMGVLQQCETTILTKTG